MTPGSRGFTFCQVLAALPVAAPVHAQNALETIVRSTVIRIAVPTDFPPHGFIGTDQTVQGLDIEMARYIAAKLGVWAELVPVTSAERIPSLQERKVDLVISTLGKTPQREKVVDFTIAYSPFFLGVFGPRSLEVTSPADLDKRSIAVTANSVEDTELSRVARFAKVQRFDDNHATVAAYSKSKTQLIATGVQVAAAIAAKDPTRGAELKFVLKDSPNFIGLGKGENEPRLKINEVLAQAKKSGDLDKLSVKWLGRPVGNLAP